MTISYPLTPPTNIKPSSVRWTDLNVVGVAVSPYTLQRQTFEWDGSAWGLEVSFDPLDREQAAPWIGFLSALRGQVGTFYWGDELFKNPLGAAGGTPRVNGANQVGFSLVSDGWPNSTLVLKAGDMFQVDNALYRNLTNATTNGSGQVTLDVWPRLRTHSDNASIVTSSPKGVFRLTDNSIQAQEASRDQLYRLDFKAIEAV